ncbi:MAG: hypothetical protein ACLQLG_11010 [Thermoguttaceae bacterium]
MNYFAHALPFLEEPYFVAGTAVPDWLSVVDRGVRVRRRHAEPFAQAAGAPLAAVARGLIQHLRDDARFHESRTFAESSLELSGATRQVLGQDPGFRPSFLGHLLVEVLLDASLAARDAGRVELFYRTLEAVEPLGVQEAVNRMAPRPTNRLAAMIAVFRRQRLLGDYLDDGRLLARLNQVMRRVRFAPLPDRFVELLPWARRLIEQRRDDLLAGIPA